MAKQKVDKKLAKKFGAALRKARKSQRISQEQLAAAADFHRTYVGFLEQGRRQPSLKVVFDLAYGLQIMPSDLVRYVECEYFDAIGDRSYLEAAEENKPFGSGT